MTAPRLICALLIYFPPQRAQEITVMSFYDIMIICSILLAVKPLCMHRGNAILCASASITARIPSYYSYTQTLLSFP